MSKILKNTTGSPISIMDTGITIPASPGQYTIPEQDYLLWAASVNVISPVNSGNIVVNNGSGDLSASRGLAYLKATNATHITGIEVDYSTIGDQKRMIYDQTANKMSWINENPGQAAGAKGNIQYRGNQAGSFAATTELNWSENKSALTIGPEPVSVNNIVISAVRSLNSWVQSIVQNSNSGTQATADLVIENDQGTDDTYYADFGINSSGYNDPQYPLSLANDSYLYNTGGHFTIGTADRQFGTLQLKDLIFHTGGFTLDDERFRLKDAVLKKDAQAILKAVLILDKNTTANRPTNPTNGMLRYNTTTDTFEFYENGIWVGLGSTAANVGTGSGQVFRDKVGQTINLKTLKAGVGTSIVNNANDILITALGGTGSGGYFIANFSNTANSNSNVFLNTFGVAASDNLPAICPIAGTINQVTVSLNGVGSGTFEFRVNTSAGAPAATVTLTNQQTITASISIPVNAGDKVNCKVASGASGIAKPLVNIYM